MRRLEWESYPRSQMFLLVALTGLAGMLASYWLLRAGMETMLARYPLAVACAYVVFLLLLWLWLRTKAEDYGSVDVPQPSGGSGSSGRIQHDPSFRGGGGESSGGGASGDFHFDGSLPSPSVPDIPGGDAVGKVAGEAIGAADEAAIPLVIVLVVAGVAAALLFASLYVVYLAPALFAELLVDGVLSASLYRRMRGLQARHWLESAVRRTVVPFVVTAFTLGAIGHVLQAYAPEARTLGQVFQHYRALSQP